MTELVIVNVAGIIFAMLFLVVVLTALGGGNMRKSKKYRKFLADMYIAAKIKVLAKNDDLDIEEENESYKAWCKKEKLSNRDYDLDNTIEEELIEKVSAEIPKKKK